MIAKTILHYNILEKIGEGGMGEVYLAEDTNLKRTVALKFLPSQLIRDDVARKRFIYEAQTASALDHPNIGTIFEINENRDTPFISMAYYGGCTLKEKITAGKIDIKEAVTIALNIAKGLKKAHSKNIIHRDVKPANIIFSEDNELKIIDFGLAKLTGDRGITQTGTTVGTLAYMSPEQLQGSSVDQRTDIWALGVVLYEMLAGECPFQGDYEQALMYSVINEEPEYITKVRNDVPSEIEQIINKALNKNPDKRFNSMNAMQEALQGTLDSLEIVKKIPIFRLKLGRKQRRKFFQGISALIVLSIIIVGLFLWNRFDIASTSVTIALLPLKNISNEIDQEWFTDGMTDALITKLARISGLKIISRSSVMKYKDSDKEASEIAAELGVSYIIEGSVFKMKAEIKISAFLIDANKNEYLWAQDYQRDLKGILTLQGELAQTIAQQIKVKLTSDEMTFLSRDREVNPEAYEAYLMGNFHWFKLTPQDIETSIQYYTRATDLDPQYAPAYAGIALAHFAPAQMGYKPIQIAAANAKPFIVKALQLDSTLAEIHYMQAVINTWGTWNWEAAAPAYKKAIKLNPNLAEARAYYSHFLFMFHEPEEAMIQIGYALELDPFNTLFIALYGMDLMYARRYDDVITMLEKSLQTAPRDPITLSTLRSAYHQKKLYKKALDIWHRSFEVNNDPEAIAALDRGNEQGGYARALQLVAETFIERSKTKYVTPWQIATLYTRAGMNDEALEWFEKAFEVHDPNMPYLAIDPIFDTLRDDPRYIALINKLGLPQPLGKRN